MAGLKSYGMRWFAFKVFVGTLALGFAPKAFSQDEDTKRPANNAPQTAARSKYPTDPTELSEWRILLDNLAVEARTLEPEHERPLIIAELADAYWQSCPGDANAIKLMPTSLSN